MTTNLNALELGTILSSGQNTYRIVEVLGQGGFGITYLAVGEVQAGNITTEAKFAVKEHFPGSLCTRSGAKVTPRDGRQSDYLRSQADFIAEAKKLHALGTENDNIVKVNEVFEANDTAYYVMQYINGETLKTFVESHGKMTYDEAVDLLTPIINAVDFLHHSRINHLDIKPENIMLHKRINGIMPILIDFGLSVHFKKNGDKTSPKGVYGVSEGYSPMEQYAGIKRFMPATDIYALMATLLYMLTATTPPAAADLTEAHLRKVLKDRVPAGAEETICKAMSKLYEQRTPSIAMLKADLGITGGSGSDTVQINVADEARKKKRNKLVGLAVGAFVVVFACMLMLGSGGGKALPAVVGEPVIGDSIEAEEIEFYEEPEPEPTDSANVVQDTPAPQPVPAPQPAVTEGTLQWEGGTWHGPIRNGMPNGLGHIDFYKSTIYCGQEVHKGYWADCEYENGHLYRAAIYDENRNKIHSFIP